MIDLQSSKPRLLIRPNPKMSQPQVIVIPQSMLANNNSLKNIFSIGNIQTPVVSRVSRPPVAIVKKPAETSKPVAVKRPLSVSNDSDDDSSTSSFGDDSNRIRKRANLDHMSHEEKLMRRKLKNRVAAQNARDKKKVKMDEMEETIKYYEQQNKALLQKNKELLAENSRLMAENQSLKSRQLSPLTMLEIKEEEDTPFSTQMLTPPTSNTPPLSDEEDDVTPSIQHTDTPSESSNCLLTVPLHERVCSPVLDRLLVPAEPINVLQPQGQGRSKAEEQPPHAVKPSQQQLMSLIWMVLCCAQTAAAVATTTSQLMETSSQSETSLSTFVQNNSLPPKKRGHWWGSHQDSPHAKT